MENIPHIHYLALRGTPKEKMIEVVILNSFFPAVFDINIKSFADGAEDKNCFKIYEITWNIVQFLRDIQSTVEIFSLPSNTTPLIHTRLRHINMKHQD